MATLAVGLSVSVFPAAAVSSAAASGSVEALVQTKLTPPFPRADNFFGAAVAIDGDTAVVGEYRGDGGVARSGVAWVYVKKNNTWVLQAKLSSPTAAPADYFGRSVAISANTIVVGAPSEHALGAPAQQDGVAHVFVRSGTTWTERATLFTLDDLEGYPDFGYSVAIDGATIAIGARGVDLRDDRETNSGAVYVYVGSDNSWALQARLESDDGIHDKLGFPVVLDGETLAAGAGQDDSPGFQRDGAVYVFVRAGSTWTREAKIIAPDPADGIAFGSSLDLDDNTAIATSGAVRGKPGAAYIFRRSGGEWSLQAEPTPLDPEAVLGQAGVSVQGNIALVGDPFGASTCGYCGVVYVFVRSGSTWTQKKVIVPAKGENNAQFGSDIDFDGVNAIIGANATTAPGGGPTAYAGAAFIVRK